RETNASREIEECARRRRHGRRREPRERDALPTADHRGGPDDKRPHRAGPTRRRWCRNDGRDGRQDPRSPVARESVSRCLEEFFWRSAFVDAFFSINSNADRRVKSLQNTRRNGSSWTFLSCGRRQFPAGEKRQNRSTCAQCL